MVETCGDAPDVASSGITFTPTDSALYQALGEYLKTVLPSPFRIKQGQQNRTPSPVGPYCVMQLITTRLLATNGWSYTDASRVVTELREVTVQVSAFGTGAGDALKQVCGLWRDFLHDGLVSDQRADPVAPLRRRAAPAWFRERRGSVR